MLYCTKNRWLLPSSKYLYTYLQGTFMLPISQNDYPLRTSDQACMPWVSMRFNTLRPRQNVRHFADDIFKCIFLNENVGISLKISLKFVPEVRINNIPALVQIMAWNQPGDKPLSEPMTDDLLTHICITWFQWVKKHQQSAPPDRVYMN